ncbi:hypothetical protein TVAG_427560 [Trichomonas vaginalis G3]|uniref:Initiator binding domain-containing protein n=1 Tax=Trichomonas vaginalis (strain ATCC PRA-98 / G3) TaxID=412133 RepID=A2F675_TRIV3|nr:transcription-initiator DNA-binding domain ibd family [Trichomonas vaginalis G3]EAX99592.1 hypothetical protein TVAG_427560 [Trichomonas vaginalis G3]KAI5506457.1 transcription-initiator DNA-binding domain ibd family [Trichomonas vaginalis G3]|eukprot:XP_001312522.1 hypothetical protein [Trichomonas vaginalis G3]
MEGAIREYYSLLTESDKQEYNSLRQSLTSSECRNCRHKRLENFNDMLQRIHKYINKNDGDDWKRALVCGVCWISDGIAINTHQLSYLLGKCKSSINGSLHKLQYSPFPSSNQASKELMEIIPRLKSNFAELRQWTLRKHVIMTPQPNIIHEVTPTSLTPVPQIDFDPSSALPVQTSTEVASVGSAEPFFDDDYMLPFQQWANIDE